MPSNDLLAQTAMFDGGTGLPAGLPPPLDDGAAAHLPGKMVPDLPLPSTSGTSVCLARLQGRTVLYVYPLTGRPGKELPPGWDLIPGARGCTPQSCGFRDLHAELRAAGADHVLGLSTQSPEYQLEMAERLHLPFPVLSDDALVLGRGLGLPTFEVEGQVLLKRLVLIIDSGRITHVFYPVFPPDQSANTVLEWLKQPRSNSEP